MAKTRPSSTRREITAPSTARPAATSTTRPKAATPPKPATDPKPHTSSAFKVRATKLGYYDHARRRPGDVFVIASEQDFSKNWMERVDPRTPEKVTGANEAIRQQHDEILAMRHGGGVPAADSGDTPMQVGDDGDDNPLGD